MPSLIRIEEVARRTALAPKTIRNLQYLKRFPSPVKIGLRAVAWRVDVIDAWIASRQPARVVRE